MKAKRIKSNNEKKGQMAGCKTGAEMLPVSMISVIQHIH